MEHPVEGDRLGDRYRLIERRAAGATATVWAAHDELLDRRVAVKVLHPHLADDELGARFAEEARTSATVTHPGLVAVYDTIAGPPPAIVLEWVDGGDLRRRLDTGTIDPLAVADIGAAVADALAALHTRGLVHRDVKPANVLLTPDGQPKLADFGIATTNPGDRTATGVVLGTAKYLSPEQVRGEPIDGRTDIYALCAVLYEALTGRPPFERDGDLPTAIARLEEAPPPPQTLQADLPPGLAAIVLRGLEREPAARWLTARDLRDQLRAFGAGDATVMTTPPSLDSSAPAGDSLDPTVAGTAEPAQAPTRRPASPAPTGKIRPRRKRWPRLVGFLVLFAIAVLGWRLLTAGGGGVGDVIDRLDGTAPDVVGATAFDPEGSGTPGEYDELAVNVLDDDSSTNWHTERYEQRDLGRKSGVGLILELAQRARVDEVEIHTVGGTQWGATVHVVDEVGADITAFGPPDAVGSGLGETSTLRPDATGRHVLVWFVDLGQGDLPIRLIVDRIVVR